MRRMGIRVLLVDNHILLRHGVKMILQAEPDIEVVGEAAEANEAIEKTVALAPDLVLIEIMLPDGEGPAAIRAIRQRCPRAQVLVLTACAQQDGFRKAAAAGAIGYVLKDIAPANLVNAIRAAHGGRTMLSPVIAKQLIEHYATNGAAAGQPAGSARGPEPPLTRHEIDVLAGVVQGLSDKQIAAELLLSEATVKTRLRAVYHKLGLRNRAHAAVFAVEHGLIRGT